MSTNKYLLAYEIHEQHDMPITAAPFDRDWMDTSRDRFAYRCLPLVIANQAGWLIRNPTTFSAIWNGGHYKHDTLISFDTGGPPPPMQFQFSTTTVVAPREQANSGPVAEDPRIMSHFGAGVFTFSIPYLFRTPPGINLWVKGPTNYIKDGAQALEGVIETDWLPATFTMNWKLTRPRSRVTFHKGEPICMVVPIPRGLAESMDPVQCPIGAEPEVERQFQVWEKGRANFLSDLEHKESEAVKQGWQKHYFQGKTETGERVPEHQTKLDLKEFRRVEKLEP
jgi:hypothetical protein